MSTERDERWLEVLAGRQEPDDESTRQAASARGYFERRAAEDMQGAPDAERQQRLLSYMQARAAAPQRAAAAPVAASRASGFASALKWLFPSGGNNGMRYAVTAALVLGVGVTFILPRDHPDDDSGTIKQFPPVHAPAETDKLSSADPQAQAVHLQGLLLPAGVVAKLSNDGEDRLIEAQIPPERIAELRTKLAAEGLRVPDDGKLRIRIQKGN